MEERKEREGGREERINGGKEGSAGCWKEERKKGGMMEGSVEVSMHCYTKNQYNFKQEHSKDTSLHPILPSSCISSLLQNQIILLVSMVPPTLLFSVKSRSKYLPFFILSCLEVLRSIIYQSTIFETVYHSSRI